METQQAAMKSLNHMFCILTCISISIFSERRSTDNKGIRCYPKLTLIQRLVVASGHLVTSALEHAATTNFYKPSMEVNVGFLAFDEH